MEESASTSPCQLVDVQVAKCPPDLEDGYPEQGAGTSYKLADDGPPVSDDKKAESDVFRWFRWIKTIDGIAALAFLCNIMALSLPVLLVPIAVQEQVLYQYDNDGNINNSNDDGDGGGADGLTAARIAHVTSMAFFGGAIGKFVNGFICDEIGTHRCSQLYMISLGVCSLLFSFSNNPHTMGVAYAGMEFFASIQYGALAVMVSNYYEDDFSKLASALTSLGLASTGGEIMAKSAGTILAGFLHWRIVAQIGAAVAFLGAAVVSQAPGREAGEDLLKLRKLNHSSWSALMDPIRSILGSPQFWILSAAYSTAFVAASMDVLLVPFYYEMTHLPQNICGGLTISATLGLVHGLISGAEAFTDLKELPQKKRFLRNRYIGNVASTLGLTLLAYYGPTYISNPLVMACVLFLLTAIMTSTVAFQFFQLTAMIAQKYGNNKAVCISWLDGVGYILSIPTIRALGVVVPRYGWSAGWGMLSGLFAVGGTVMLASIGPILDHSSYHADHHDQEPWYYFDWAMDIYSGTSTDSLCGVVICH